MRWILTFYLIILFPFSIKKENKTTVNYKVHYEQNKTLKTYKIPANLRVIANYIKKHEGLRLKPYYCPGGILTIGYGHSIKRGEILTSITEPQADSILISDINLSMKFVKNTLNLQGNKLLAITHFVYAVGSGNLLKSNLKKRIISGDSIDSELLKWCTIKGKFSKELLKNRKFELELWNN